MLKRKFSIGPVFLCVILATGQLVKGAYVEALPNLADSPGGTYGAWGLSADGKVIYGQANNSFGEKTGIIWESGKTPYPVALPNVVGGGFPTFPSVLSDDGTLLFGADSFLGHFLWDGQQSTLVANTEPLKNYPDLGFVTGMSSDRTIFVGRNGFYGNRVVRVDTVKKTSKTLFGFASSAADISADGRIIVGSGEWKEGEIRSFAYREDPVTEETSRIWLDSSLDNYATAISADGTVVVGTMNTELGTLGFLWKPNWDGEGNDIIPGDNITTLGRSYLGSDQTYDGSEAKDVSANGKIVVGEDQSPLGRRAVIWDTYTETNENGNKHIVGAPMRDLFGFEELGWFNFVNVGGISHDGNTIVGNAFNGAWLGFRLLLERESWRKYLVSEDGRYVDLGELIGLVEIFADPFIFIWNSQAFVYAPQDAFNDFGFWVYMLNGLGNVDSTYTPWIVLLDLSLFAYAPEAVSTEFAQWVWVPFNQ